MTEDDDEEFPGSIRPVSREEWLALTRRVSPMTEAEKERAAVVAWLEGRADAIEATNSPDPLFRSVELGMARTLRTCTRLIESGEHLKEGR